MIYYVEHNEGIRNLVTYTLNMTGFEAQGFPEGESFFKAMETQRPELILLDVMLPGEDGVTILGRLRRDPRFSAIPVIMITAETAGAYTKRAYELGAALRACRRTGTRPRCRASRARCSTGCRPCR